MENISILITQIELRPESEQPINFGIWLPQNYMEIVPYLGKKRVLQNLESTCDDINRLWNYSLGLDWDDNRGLYCVRLLNTDGTSMILNSSNKRFVPTNIDNVEQALSLLAIGQDYLQQIVVYSEVLLKK